MSHTTRNGGESLPDAGEAFHALGESLVALVLTVGGAAVVTSMVVKLAFWIVDTFILKGAI